MAAVSASGLGEALADLSRSFSFGGASVDAVRPADLGDKGFMETYGVDFPIYTGAMAKGIASADLVVAAGKRRILASLGAGGLAPDATTRALDQIQRELPNGPYCVNLIHSPFDDLLEKKNVELFMSRGVRVIEASAFMTLTPHVVRFRVAGLERGPNGSVVCKNKIIFKVSRTELAEMAMKPAPMQMVQKLVAEGYVTREQAELSQLVPVADDVAVEADSGGHTDNRPIHVILPLIIKTRNRLQKEFKFKQRVRVGAGGGLGCPEAVLAAFQMGAAFVVTGTVNQMSKQAGTCDNVRKALSKATYSDVTMAPAADMFDEGVKLQVLKQGTLFPSRANKLWDLFCKYDSLDDIPADTMERLEKTVFQCPIATVWQGTVSFYIERLGDHEKIARAERDPKLKMSLCFRWYLGQSSMWANTGAPTRVLDYQIWCGPAIGSFNSFIAGSYLDPAVAGQFPCVCQINLQLLHGACYYERLQMLKSATKDEGLNDFAYVPSGPL